MTQTTPNNIRVKRQRQIAVASGRSVSLTRMPSLLLLCLVCLLSCQDEQEINIDMVIHNADIYFTENVPAGADAVAVSEGLIYQIGTSAEILKLKQDSTKIIDADGRFLMPGLIEGHGHLSGLGASLMNLNFLKSRSWDEIVSMVEEKMKTADPEEWITGRGWHQEKWDHQPHDHVHGYPTHYMMSELTKDNPVVLRHASGHSLFANEKAMKIAGVTKDTPDPKGGEIVRDSEGKAIGVFEERAMNIIMAAYEDHLSSLSQDDLVATWHRGIALAQEECLKKGITSFQDAGSNFDELKRYEALANDKKLDLRLWVMARHSADDLIKNDIGNYRKIGVGDGFYTCRALKTEVDGALGSYGAWLLEPYNDKPDFVGQNTTDIEEVERIAAIAKSNDMQLCVHAIGDRANREVLDIFERQSTEDGDQRWRIEHAQHLHPDDIPRFKDLGAIAAMQAIHCTSDAPFVEKRLGEVRSREGAYPWRSLLDAGALVNNGTDAPVEDVDPIPSLYASVTRKRADSGLAFFPEQSMTRREALDSYTISNAFAAFEEDKKGSIEVGKYADFTILDRSLLSCTEDEILDTKVLYTIVDGLVKYQKID